MVPVQGQVLPGFKVTLGFQKWGTYPRHTAMNFWNDGHNCGVIDDTSCLKHGIYLNAWRALLTDRPTTCEAHKCKRTWMILDVLGWHMMTLEAGRGWRVDVCINQVGWRPSTSDFASSSALLWSSSLHTGGPTDHHSNRFWPLPTDHRQCPSCWLNPGWVVSTHLRCVISPCLSHKMP